VGLSVPDGVPVAMGGWRFRPDVRALGRSRAAEVKRMYVVPAAQRRGYARIVLRHLETTARSAGADVMVLETGLMQPEAIALYESSGYEPVPAFGFYRDSPTVRNFGKRL
jgi:GNAT superfamily N-acetyltransferase